MTNFQKKREERNCLTAQLLENIKNRLPELDALLEKYSRKWRYDDSVYRFYHQSNKVFGLQNGTLEIAEALRALLPARELNTYFRAILDEGTGKTFSLEDNARWL